MKRSFALGLAFVLAVLVIPYVLAIDTEINVKTLPEYKVSVFVLDPDPAVIYGLYNSYHVYSDILGQAKVTYTGDQGSIKIKVQISKDGKDLLIEKFDESFQTGKPLYLQVIPGSILRDYMEAERSKTLADESNKTIVNSTEEVNITSDDKLTGKATSSFKMPNIPRYVYYIVAGVLAVGILVFFVIKHDLLFLHRNPSSIAVRKYSEMRESANPKEISVAEKKLKEAQVEIDKLKKINEIQSRIAADEEELRKLRRG